MFLLSSTFVDLGGQMQRLNNNRQFKQSIALFDAHTEKQPNAFAVNQALKACIQLDDINRGIQIHHNLPSSFVYNDFIQATLIHLYSRSFTLNFDFHHSVSVKAGDYVKAQEIFRKNKKKSSVICVAILKGTNDFVQLK